MHFALCAIAIIEINKLIRIQTNTMFTMSKNLNVKMILLFTNFYQFYPY